MGKPDDAQECSTFRAREDAIAATYARVREQYDRFTRGG